MNGHKYIHDPRVDAEALESFFRGLDTLKGFRNTEAMAEQMGWEPLRFTQAINRLCKEQDIPERFKFSAKMLIICNRLMPHNRLSLRQAINNPDPVDVEDTPDVQQALRDEINGNTLAASPTTRRTSRRGKGVPMAERIEKLEALIKELGQAGTAEKLGKMNLATALGIAVNNATRIFAELAKRHHIQESSSRQAHLATLKAIIGQTAVADDFYEKIPWGPQRKQKTESVASPTPVWPAHSILQVKQGTVSLEECSVVASADPSTPSAPVTTDQPYVLNLSQASIQQGGIYKILERELLKQVLARNRGNVSETGRQIGLCYNATRMRLKDPSTNEPANTPECIEV